MLPACGLKGAYQPHNPAQRRVRLLQPLLLLVLLRCRRRLFMEPAALALPMRLLTGQAAGTSEAPASQRWTIWQHGGACQSPGRGPRARRESSNRCVQSPTPAC